MNIVQVDILSADEYRFPGVMMCNENLPLKFLFVDGGGLLNSNLY